MATTATDREALTREWMTVAHSEEYDRFGEFLAESYVLVEPGIPAEGVAGPEGEAHGPEGVADYMRLVHQAFPDMTVAIDQLVGREDVVFCEARMRYTWTGEWRGLEPTGNAVDVPFVEVIGFEGESIASQRSYMDTQAVLAQMGLA